MLGSVQGVRDLAQAERICRYKSGKYTIERPLHLGAALAAPDRFDAIAPRLSAYGLPLGDAFQMRDDVMGAFGDERTTGKPVGGDLREGKPTPLLARALAVATTSQQQVLATVGQPGLTDDRCRRDPGRCSSTPARSLISRPRSRRSPPRRSPPLDGIDLDAAGRRRADRARRVRQPARGLTCASSSSAPGWAAWRPPPTSSAGATRSRCWNANRCPGGRAGVFAEPGSTSTPVRR